MRNIQSHIYSNAYTRSLLGHNPSYFNVKLDDNIKHHFCK